MWDSHAVTRTAWYNKSKTSGFGYRVYCRFIKTTINSFFYRISAYVFQPVGFFPLVFGCSLDPGLDQFTHCILASVSFGIKKGGNKKLERDFYKESHWKERMFEANALCLAGRLLCLVGVANCSACLCLHKTSWSFTAFLYPLCCQPFLSPNPVFMGLDMAKGHCVKTAF